jgi:hypothetical protein
MQGMRSDSAEVRAMLSALVPNVKNYAEVFTAQHIGMALYGLQVKLLTLLLMPLAGLHFCEG